MKLEVGKYYRTRDGVKRGPVEDRGTYFAASGWHYYYNGTHFYGDPNQNLVEEWKDEMKITMDGKYAYRKDPYTQVRILCVDRPGHVSDPVCSMDPVTGFIYYHTESGKLTSLVRYPCEDFDLVPLQEKLPDLWVNIYPDGKNIFAHYTEKSALNGKRGSFGEGSIKTIRYIPAPDQDTL